MGENENANFVEKRQNKQSGIRLYRLQGGSPPMVEIPTILPLELLSDYNTVKRLTC